MKTPPLARPRWRRAYRIINSRYPPIHVFERVADPADWDTLYALEQLTNPRVRETWGEISIVPVHERVFGTGASWVMAAFTHRGNPSRFTDGTFGVYYAARSIETAVRETAYHFGRFLRETQETAGTELDMRTLVSQNLSASFHDVRAGFPALHQENYAAPQKTAMSLRSRGSNGIVYNSVRHPPSGECLVAFRPKAIPIPVQGSALKYHFDGSRIDRWFQIGDAEWNAL